MEAKKSISFFLNEMPFLPSPLARYILYNKSVLCICHSENEDRLSIILRQSYEKSWNFILTTATDKADFSPAKNKSVTLSL
jgi:hypothetical protein